MRNEKILNGFERYSRSAIENQDKKTRVIYNQRLAGYLMQKGFVLVDISPNDRHPRKNVFFFFDTPELQVTVNEYFVNPLKEFMEVIRELANSGGTMTQEKICKFLLRLANVNGLWKENNINESCGITGIECCQCTAGGCRHRNKIGG